MEMKMKIKETEGKEKETMKRFHLVRRAMSCGRQLYKQNIHKYLFLSHQVAVLLKSQNIYRNNFNQEQ